MMASTLLLVGCTMSRWAENEEESESPVAAQVERTVEKKRKPVRLAPKKVELQTVEDTPKGLPRPFVPKLPGKRVAQVNVPGPYVALTFDDGPNPANTPKILDILNRYGAKATFFVVGQCAVRHKDILARAASEGHEIAAHTWSHIKMTGSSDEKIISEMDRTNAVIAEAIGHRPVLMRPPYGATNSRVQDLMMSRYGMTSVMWSIDTEDWKHPGVSVVTNRAVNQARNGSIILLHDIHASTLAAVEGVVAGLQRRGFKLVTVSELIEMGRGAAKAAGLAAQSVPAAQPAQELVNAEEAPAAAPTAVVVEPAPAEPAQNEEPAAQAGALQAPQEVAYPTQEL